MLNYQMGLGHESYNPDLGGVTSEFRFSDSNQRRFYQRWSKLMAAGGGPGA